MNSIWFETLPAADRALLARSDRPPRTAEVAIVGAGMIGLASAWYLSEAGMRDICVLDRATALAEASGANAGGLWFGQQSPELGAIAEIARASGRLDEGLASTPGFEFDFRRTGLLELLWNEPDAAQAGGTAAAVRQAGFRVEQVDAAGLRDLEPALSAGPAGALFYPDEAQLHPAKLGACFVRALRNRNVRFCFESEVVDVAPGRVSTGGGELSARAVVIAAGAWTPLVTRSLGWQPPIRPMRGQLLATRPLGPVLAHTVLGRRYYYWQLGEGHVAGGGTVEDVGFERGTDPEQLSAICLERDSLIPVLAGEAPLIAWSGFRPFCADLLPVVGKVPGQENVYVAAGHFKKGIMLAPVTGKIVADLITEGATRLPADPLSPARF